MTFLAARYSGHSQPIEYDAAFDATSRRLDRLVEEEGWTPWARALDAMHQGIDGLFASNRGEYLLLLERCGTVLEHLDVLEEEAPEFVDVQLAGGLFDYWATVIAHELPYVPAFSDRRAVGLELMRDAAKSGSLLRGPAAWGLTLSLVDAGYPEEALPWAEALVQVAPDSSLAAMAWDLSSDPGRGARWAESMRRAMRRSSAAD